MRGPWARVPRAHGSQGPMGPKVPWVQGAHPGIPWYPPMGSHGYPPMGSLGTHPWDPWVPPLGSPKASRALKVKSPLSPYNRQNGGHSDLEGEKLVYNFSSSVPEVPAKFPEGRGGDTFFDDFLKNQEVDFFEKSLKKVSNPLPFGNFAGTSGTKEEELYTSFSPSRSLWPPFWRLYRPDGDFTPGVLGSSGRPPGAPG